MKVYYCGFNGFKQWSNENLLVKEFTLLENSQIVNFSIGWSHNIFQQDSKFIITGFCDGKPKSTSPICHPSEIEFSGVSCNDDYALFWNKWEIWKYQFPNLVKDKWKLILSIQNSENEDEILKVVSDSRMNLALTSKGRLFSLPVQMDLEHFQGNIIDVCCGHEHGIALTDTGNVYTWGTGSRCQLGHGSIEDLEHPQLVKGLAGIKVVKIAAGGWHCSIITEYGDLYSWGWNESGQLGTDEEQSTSEEKKIKLAVKNYAIPILINFNTNVKDVSCGSKHTIAILEDGSVWGSGNNKYAQLGIHCEDDKLLYFKQINVQVENPQVICKWWNSVIFSNKE